MSDETRDQELASTRDALATAIRIGETLQRRVDESLELLREHDDDPVVQLVIAKLEGTS